MVTGWDKEVSNFLKIYNLLFKIQLNKATQVTPLFKIEINIKFKHLNLNSNCRAHNYSTLILTVKDSKRIYSP
jgi:hypothetical protein